MVVSPAHRRRIEELLEGRELQARARRRRAGRGGDRARFPAAAGRRRGLRRAAAPGAGEAPAPAETRSRFGPFLSGLRDLKVGDFVVHVDHGIGQFVALRSVGGNGDGAGGLPPVVRDLATAGAGRRDRGDGDLLLRRQAAAAPPLAHRPGAEVQRHRGGRAPPRPARRHLVEQDQGAGQEGDARHGRGAAEALRRAPGRARPGDAPGHRLLHQFEAAFPYEETPDQLEAIATIREDLQRERPMDRLLCGDVGYGKTEVAMRAAFKAVDGG